MNIYLKRFLQGLLLGVALITAIGGGTMAVLIGVYDDLINSVTGLRKQTKKSLSILIPTGIGMLVSVGILFYPIKLLLEHFPFITISFFVGTILGGLRTFQKSLKGHFSAKNLVLTLIGFLFVFGLGAFSFFSTLQGNLTQINVTQIIILFFVIFLTVGSHISPGISGTFVLIAFGYYKELIDFAFRLIRFDFVNIGYDLAAAFTIVVAAILGIIIIAKVYKHFLTKNRIKTYFTILGFILGSVTIAFFNYEIRTEYEALTRFEPLTLIFSLIALAAGATISHFLLGLIDKKEQAHTEIKSDALDVQAGNDDDVTLGV